MIALYVSDCVDSLDTSGICPAERLREIQAVDSPRLKMQKISSWKLLARAVRERMGCDLSSLGLYKNSDGKWLSDKVYFSLSHTEGKVAVALSDKPVGVDIEGVRPFEQRCERSPSFATSLEKRIACRGESFSTPLSLLEAWTQKESIFKCVGGGAFVPRNIALEDYNVRTFIRDGYCISVCGEGLRGQTV